MNKVEAIIRPERLSTAISTLAEGDYLGLNFANAWTGELGDGTMFVTPECPRVG